MSDSRRIVDPASLSLEEKEQLEIDWYLHATKPGGECDWSNVDSIINKFEYVVFFRGELRKYSHYFQNAASIMEIGGGVGWASCLVKRLYPSARVIFTDISPHAVAMSSPWEAILGAKPDQAFVAKCYEIPVPDRSLELVFANGAAHHFVAHEETFAELHRILTPGGVAIYFCENCVSSFLYPLFKWTQQRQRSDCPEDLIQHTKLCVLAERAGFSSQMDFILDSILGQTNLLKALKWTNYMGALRFIPGLRRLPLSICTFVFRKAAD
jgi:SAM-dependent methyltransferase